MAVGRPRTFDVDRALDAALTVFWRKGYEGTSLSDLTTAMGINRPSLYAAFGNKEDLFRKALDRYVTHKVAYLRESMGAPTARGVAENMLTGAANMLTDTSHPVGCLAVQGALTCSDQAESIRQELVNIRNDFDTRLSQRLTQAQAAGEFPPGTDAGTLARYLSTVIQGMSVQAASGASRDDLMKVVHMALAAWPETPKKVDGTPST